MNATPPAESLIFQCPHCESWQLEAPIEYWWSNEYELLLYLHYQECLWQSK